MSQLQSHDRQGAEIKVGDIVTYADRDEMHGGTVAYIAGSGLRELAIEDPKRGLVIRYGEETPGAFIVYDCLIVQRS
ncbi:hypothetical protein ACFW9O_05920 [Streptomyces sp. NPDC059499]|uniref:hypothetical protein n=1 Tax=Streptomyces sp. NPDC059499 TaxID=3346852 RepID=UPI003680AA39